MTIRCKVNNTSIPTAYMIQFAASSSTGYYGPRGCDGAGRVRVRLGGLSVREGVARIGVGGVRVRGGGVRVRGGEARDGRIGVVGWANGVPDLPSGLSSGVHCLNVTRLA